MAGKHHLRWGYLTAAGAVLVVGVLAFVPDPFLTKRVFAARFDDVEGVAPGAAVFFRGAQVGSVREVVLDPASRLFDVRLGIRRDWRPSSCSFARIAESNPLTTPRIELVAVEVPAARCADARLAAQCDRLPGSGTDDVRIDGCRRGAGLFQTAALAVGEAAAVARTANQMAARLGAMLGSGAGGGSPIDMAKIANDSTAALASLSAISQQLDASMRPGRGDIALTLANVRRASGRAGEFDIASLNGTMREVRTMVSKNQESVAGILSEAQGTTAQSRALLENMAASLAATSANLERASDSITGLTERLAADPTFALRGRKFADPPAPGPAQ